MLEIKSLVLIQWTGPMYPKLEVTREFEYACSVKANGEGHILRGLFAIVKQTVH